METGHANGSMVMRKQEEIECQSVIRYVSYRRYHYDHVHRISTEYCTHDDLRRLYERHVKLGLFLFLLGPNGGTEIRQAIHLWTVSLGHLSSSRGSSNSDAVWASRRWLGRSRDCAPRYKAWE